MSTLTENIQKKTVTVTDFEVDGSPATTTGKEQPKKPSWHLLQYAAVGMLFGIVFVKAEIMSWFRIQEMFHLQSFHMYGVIGTAVVVGMISVWIIKKFNLKTIDGSPITFTPKKFHKGNIYGSIIFGLGWGITGACPGPLFAQVGSGVLAASVMIISALAGTWVYGNYRERLPH